MLEESKNERVTLSRFFKENLNAIKNRNILEDFDNSPYISSVANKKQNVKERKKKKLKYVGPQFKGFLDKEKESAKIDKERMNLLVAGIKGVKCNGCTKFLGFSNKEIDHSNRLCNKTGEQLKHFRKITSQFFLGFSKQDQIETVSKLSNILEKCESIRKTIYKNIDRRVLTNHLQESKARTKVVCSKYWPKQDNSVVKMENVKRLKNSDEESNNSDHILHFKPFKVGGNFWNKKSVKYKIIKTETSAVKQEYECDNIKQELKSILQNNIAPSQDEKLQDAPFIQIKKELIIPPFIPPKSPHHLVEEDLYHDPWALLVATIFLNKTSGRTARPYIFWFLDENPDPLIVLEKRVDQLETYFGALGLQKTRAYQVWKMSHDFIYKKWKKVSELYGIGRYGEDAFKMFCLGDFSIEPKDRYLRIYKSWYLLQERKNQLKEINS